MKLLLMQILKYFTEKFIFLTTPEYFTDKNNELIQFFIFVKKI